MGFLLGAVFEALIWLVLQVIGEFLMAIGWVAVSSPFRRDREIPAPVAGIGIVIVAFFIAWVYDFFVPDPILPPPPFPGASLILAPIAVGGLTHLAGKWLAKKGLPSSHLLTYWGGALFAFVLAGTRFILLH